MGRGWRIADNGDGTSTASNDGIDDVTVRHGGHGMLRISYRGVSGVSSILFAGSDSDIDVVIGDSDMFGLEYRLGPSGRVTRMRIVLPREDNGAHGELYAAARGASLTDAAAALA